MLRVFRTNRIVLQHRQRTVGTWADQRLVVAGHGHGDEAHGDGAGLDYMEGQHSIPPLFCIHLMCCVRALRWYRGIVVDGRQMEIVVPRSKFIRAGVSIVAEVYGLQCRRFHLLFVTPANLVAVRLMVVDIVVALEAEVR